MDKIYTVGILMVGIGSAALFEKALPVASLLESQGYEVPVLEPVELNQQTIEKKLSAWAEKLDLIITMGGVSLKPQDVVPEATEAVCQRMVPGMAEAMRTNCYAFTPRAMLSRETAGICNQAIILNLPGSSQAAKENLSVVLPALQHALDMLR